MAARARRPVWRQLAAAGFVFSLAPFATESALAANCTFIPVGGNWSLAGNWSCAVVPSGGANDSATINTGSTVTIDTAQSIDAFSNAGTLNINAFLLSLEGGSTTNTGTINVGAGPIPNNAALNIGGGHNVNNTGGTINVSADSVVNQFGSTITGGILNTTGTGRLVVYSSAANFLNGVTLNGQMDMATISDSRQRSSGGFSLGTSGLVNINANGILSFDGNSTLSGTGSIVFGATGAGNRVDLDANGTTTLGSGITIRGTNGTIGREINIGGTQTLVNNGTISADVTGGQIEIVQSAVTNNGTLSALNGGRLVLSSDVAGSSTGQVLAGAGSVVLQNGVTLSGIINTSGTGQFQVTSSAQNRLSGVEFNGVLDMASIPDSRERVLGGLELNGRIDINANGILSSEGSNVFSGAGTIVFGGTGPGNRFDLDSNGTTTLSAGFTVRGQNGTIGREINIGGTQVLVNNGLVSADVAGGQIEITGSAVTNNGTLRALNGGRLVLTSDVTGGVAGQIFAGTGSVVLQNGSTLSGTINTAGSGLFTVISSAQNRFSNITLNGNVDMATTSDSRERVVGGSLVLNGQVDINSNGILSFEGDSMLGGTGSIVFGGTGAGNRVDLDGNGTTTFSAGTIVRGQNGTIGRQINIGGTQVLVNNGIVSADVAGGQIEITESAVTNNGTLRALNGGKLVLSSNVTGAATGQILSGAGSVVVQNGVVLSGIINTTGSGQFQVTSSAANYLSGVEFNGVLDMASIVTSRERVIGDLELNGRIDINGNGILSSEGTNVFSGAGTIVFGDAGAGNRLDLDANGTTTLASGFTVRGQNGTIGRQLNIGGTQVLVNNGLVSADVAGGQIEITESAVTNNGTLRALNGGKLVLSSNVTGTASGQILAGAGSVVVQNGVVLSGIINTTGSGQFQVTSSAANYLSGVEFNGVLDMASIATSRERVTGDLELNGRIDINGNGSLSSEGTNVFSGTGSIVFGDAGGGNHFDLDANGTTTLGAGITVRGQNGTIGRQINIGGTQVLVNNGKVSADVSGGTITIDDSSVVNNALLEARNGGLLVLSSNVDSGTSGVILADGGNVLQSAVRLTGGRLQSANGGVVRVASSSANYLDGVTIDGVLDMATIATGRERVQNGLTVNGRVDLNQGAILSFEGTGTLGGTGEIVFGSSAGNQIALDGNGTTTIGSGITVHGHSGTIGPQINIGGTQTLVNNGRIIADVAGGVIGFADSALVNNGTVGATFGTVNIGVPLSGTGRLEVASTGAINLANGAKTQGVLAVGGAGAALNIGTGNLTIDSDYTNVGAGTGNAFNRRAGITGTGLIVSGGDAAQAITGAGVTGGNTTNATLTIGNVRVGANTFNYQVANTGTTGPTLRGAIQTNVNGGNITDARLSGTGVTASNYNAGGPGSNSGNLAVTFTSATAGALAPLTGQVLNLRSNFEDIADQKLNIVLQGGAAAYNAAIGSTGSPVVIANQRVGGTNSAALSVLNAAAVGSFSEDLDATIGGTSGAATGTGNVLGLLAGSTNSSGISVGVNTATAGAKTGTVTLDYVSTGTVNGVSNNLAPISVGSQGVSVSGNVYQLASGDLLTAPLNFGTVQVGQNVDRTLSIRNTATGAAGFVEDLNASFGTATGTGASRITGTGSITGLVAGATNSSAMSVHVDTSTAGTINGAIGVNYFSAGRVGGVSNGLGTLAVGSDSFAVNGTIEAVVSVINQASPLVNTPTINLGARRVGDASPTSFVSVTNQATTAPQAALNASIASNGAPVNASGSFALLGPGATNASSLLVGLSTAVSGDFTGMNAGSATISFVSDASNVGGCEPDCQLTIASQDVSVSGKVYQAAQAQLVGGTNVDFGTVRVGDTAAMTRVLNNAATGALVDQLAGSFTGAASPFSTNAGALGAGIAGNGGSTTLGFGLNTATAGVFSGSATASLVSRNADMADLDLGSIDFNLTGTVNNLASPELSFDGGNGTFTRNSNVLYTWDFGTVSELADAVLGGSFKLTNAADGPADDLDGLWTTSTSGEFVVDGFGAVDNLAAGQMISGLNVLFDTGLYGPGTFSGSVFLDPRSVFFGLDDVELAPMAELRFVGRIRAENTDVPAPGALMLLVFALAGMGVKELRRRGNRG